MQLNEALGLVASSPQPGGHFKVITTEPLGVRRRVDGEFEIDFLPAGSVCELVDEDDKPGTFVLLDQRGDEVWHVDPRQFGAAP